MNTEGLPKRHRDDLRFELERFKLDSAVNINLIRRLEAVASSDEAFKLLNACGYSSISLKFAQDKILTDGVPIAIRREIQSIHQMAKALLSHVLIIYKEFSEEHDLRDEPDEELLDEQPSQCQLSTPKEVIATFLDEVSKHLKSGADYDSLECCHSSAKTECCMVKATVLPATNKMIFCCRTLVAKTKVIVSQF